MATFKTPVDVAAAPRPSFAIYVADQDNHVIRVIDGGIINTFAGVQANPGDDGTGGATVRRCEHSLSDRFHT
jgi:hypothetical protein